MKWQDYRLSAVDHWGWLNKREKATLQRNVFLFCIKKTPSNKFGEFFLCKKAASRGFFSLVAEAGLEPTTFGL
jgi:hypothetical protein